MAEQQVEEAALEAAEVETTESVATEQQAETTTPSEPSAVEKRAIEMGWRPKSEFDGDPDDFIDASEFVRRKPLFEKIDTVGKELRETKKALKALQLHHQQVKEAEYQNALKALREEKKAALESGDADALIAIDDKIADEKARQIIIKQQEQVKAAQPHPNFVQWVQRNTWYSEDAELHSVADQVGTAYAVNNPEKDPDEVLKYVEKRIRTMYPEKFRNPNKDKPSAVEGVTSTPANTKKSDTGDYPLTEDERRVMMTFVRQGIMSKEEYIKDLKRVKGE